MNIEYVVHRAILYCSNGDISGILTVPEHRHIDRFGHLIANEMDIGKQCISTFGQCLETGAECDHDIDVYWRNCKIDVTVGKFQALTKESFTFCTLGSGIISIADTGQFESQAQQLQHYVETLNTYAIEDLKGKGMITDDKILAKTLDFLTSKDTPDNQAFGNYVKQQDPYLHDYFSNQDWYFKDDHMKQGRPLVEIYDHVKNNHSDLSGLYK